MNPLKTALSVRTDYSIGESSLQVGALIDRAKELGYETLAIADVMTLSAMPVFIEKAKKAGIRPIVGCTLRVVDDATQRVQSKDQNLFRPKVYVRTERGLQLLYKLLSRGLAPENFYYHSRISLQDLLDLVPEGEVSEDLVVTTGDTWGLFHRDDARTILEALTARFHVYVELTAINTPLYNKLNCLATFAFDELGLDTIVSRPVQYATPDDADSADVLRAISVNKDARSMFIPRPYNRDLCLLSQDDMLDEILSMWRRIGGRGTPSMPLLGVVSLLRNCTYEHKKLPPSLPKMAENEFVELTRRVQLGWVERFSRPVWGHVPAAEDIPKYKERLVYELGVLKKLNFSGYFLLVQQIVQWSKSQGILVGPGRGSVGGSLVAYLMGITDIDPIRFGLLFERFINPDRIDLPDADLDFMSRRRQEIVDMITEKYGADHVCGIVNFNTLGPASSLRDVARLHGLTPVDYACSKLVEKEHGVPVPLAESVATVPDLEKFANQYPTIWNHALRLEGANRALGRHAAGVVIAAEPVINRGVISTQSGQAVVQWDKSRVEDFGLIKIDILGLNTLDTIGAILKYIKDRHGVDVDVLSLKLDDKRVLEAFARGDTTGVFQFEGAGMKKLLRELGVGGDLSFDDICAATALFRPGPLDAGLCDRYVQVKQGAATPYYEHPALEECLGDTFGVIVYQEQVMKICRVLCGFTPGEADGVRKAIGKKDAEKMAEYGDKFVAGAVTSGMSEYAAKVLWEMILGFAGYAFNKSHSYEYSLISWITMYLKVYYPAEFYAGALSVVEDEDKQASLISDAKVKGIEVLPPDFLVSSDRIEIKDDKLYAPFQAVKGISESTARALVELREKIDAARAAATEPEFVDLYTWEWVPEKEVMRRRKVEGSFTKVKELAPAHLRQLLPEMQTGFLGKVKINALAQERLGKVGAFHSLGDGLPPMHADRLRDRLELMPGFTVEIVKATRSLSADRVVKMKLLSTLGEVPKCEGCSLKGKAHPVVRMGEAPRFMMVFDNPTWKDEKTGQLMSGDTGDIIKAALRDVGVKFSDGYYTALVKGLKPSEQKALTNEQINGCSQWLNKELEALKPPVIVAMGSNAVRFFAPGVKGTPADLAGKAIYRSDLDATVIFGINPGQIFHDRGKVKLIEAAFAKLAESLEA